MDAGRRKSREILSKYIKIIPKLMTNPCRIDARKNNAQNIENDANMAPKWRSNPSKRHEKTIQKNIAKNDAKIKRQKAMRPEGPLGPECQKR